MIYGTESHETKWSKYALMENAFYSHCKALLAGIAKTVAASSKSMFLNFKNVQNIIREKDDSPDPTVENALNPSMK